LKNAEALKRAIRSRVVKRPTQRARGTGNKTAAH